MNKKKKQKQIGALSLGVDVKICRECNYKAEVEKQRVEIEALKIANEKMYSANKEQEAEIERLTINMNAYGLAAKRLAGEKAYVASEIFAEIATEISKKLPLKIYCGIDGKPFNGNEMDVGRERALYEVLGLVIELKKKYTESEINGSKQ